MLPTDWLRPAARVLGRLSDHRARQFWDEQHVLAQRMAADARDPQPKPECCEQNGFLWDMAAVYPPGAMWMDKLPPAVVFNGPVVEVKAQLEAGVR
jgi:hypothetical protein